MIAVWIAVYVLAGAGLLGLILVAVLLLLIARDTHRIKRERLEREGPPLSAEERNVLDELEHGPDGS